MQIQTLPNTTIQYFEENEVRWYRMRDVTTYLDYNMDNSSHKLYTNYRNQITLREIKSPTQIGQRTFIFVNNTSLKYLMSKCRKPKVPDLCRILGFSKNIASPTLEVIHMGQLCKMFPKMQMQKSVAGYRVDGYLPQFNIVIECDELGHQAYNPDKQRERTEKINKALSNPIWVRYNPNEAGFSIIPAIAEITLAMHSVVETLIPKP